MVRQSNEWSRIAYSASYLACALISSTVCLCAPTVSRYVAQILLGGSFVMPSLLALRLCLAAGFFFLCVWSFDILHISLDSGLFALVYCIINLAQAAGILYSRRHVKFDKDREEIYSLYFDKKKNVYPKYSPRPEMGDFTNIGFKSPFGGTSSAPHAPIPPPATGAPAATGASRWVRKLPCSRVEFQQLTSLAQIRTLSPGQYLAHRGDECTSLTFLLEGELSYFQQIGAPSSLQPIAERLRTGTLGGGGGGGGGGGDRTVEQPVPVMNSSSQQQREHVKEEEEEDRDEKEVHVHSVSRLGIVDAVEWLHRHTERGPRWGVNCRAVTPVRLLCIPYSHIDSVCAGQAGLEATLTAMCGMEATRLLFQSQDEYISNIEAGTAGIQKGKGSRSNRGAKTTSSTNQDVPRSEQFKQAETEEEAELVRFHDA
jgi:hypothetical protein